jgi:hypothetical protein
MRNWWVRQIVDANFEQGSQPLKPTTALNLAGYGLPFPYFPWVKQDAEYRAVAAPILKPPRPSLTVKVIHRTLSKLRNKNKSQFPKLKNQGCNRTSNG